VTPAERERLAAFLQGALGAREVSIDAERRIHGGASRETISIDVRADGAARGLIVRRDPAASLIDTERALEFAAYRTVAGKGLPTPAAIALVETDEILGAPFFVMERIDGGAASSPFTPRPYGAHAGAIGAQLFSYLGALASIAPEGTPLAAIVDAPAPDGCWRRELDYWERVIDENELEPQPIARAAIRKLRARPPPPAQRLAIVHGDYRSGNFLHDGAGRIIAILDWEMAHIGDPQEDFAWAADELWGHGEPGLVAGTIPRADAIAAWERASGLVFNQDAHAWWSLFASLKGLAIWISSARTYATAPNPEPVLAFSGWYTLVRHNQIVAERLAREAGL
jgi:aminoglycoside phosphotransferase (APT) family kinase protein